jgi:hypothetical protein
MERKGGATTGQEPSGTGRYRTGRHGKEGGGVITALSDNWGRLNKFSCQNWGCQSRQILNLSHNKWKINKKTNKFVLSVRISFLHKEGGTSP